MIFGLEILKSHVRIILTVQEQAMTKAENMLQLIGYPDWLPEETELDAYYQYVKTLY